MQQIQMIRARYASRCHRFSASDLASFVSAEFLFFCTSLVFKCDVWLQARNELLLEFCRQYHRLRETVTRSSIL